MIYSYTRPDPSAAEKGKGKGIVDAGTLDSESEDAVVFEVYHVSRVFHISSDSVHHGYQTTWDTPGFREYHRRMQLFILLYIEGGSYINEDEDTWEFVVL